MDYRQLILASYLISYYADGLSCTEYKSSIDHKYYAVRHCQRSNKTIIGWTNVNNVDKCADFAVKRKAMAFNFAPLERGNKNFFNQFKENLTNYSKNDIIEQSEEFFNCELLACPEFHNFSHIVNDTRFDYFTLYSNPPPPINSTCIPTVGIFQYYNEFANYSTATRTCLKANGSLAHILTEKRTNSLSNFLYQQQNITRLKIAYVGLNETVNNKFRTSADEPLECFLYRAWAPGHPVQKKIVRCVAITDEDSWQTYSCLKRLPFICEIYTSGPPEVAIDFKRKCSVTKNNNGRAKQKNKSHKTYTERSGVTDWRYRFRNS